MNSLAPCPRCARHVRAAEETRCPFCGEAIAGLAPVRRRVPMTRAAIVLGAALLGCGGASSEPAQEESTVQEEAPPAEETAGGEEVPPAEDTGTEEGSDEEVSSPVMMYGSPSSDVLV